jgi:hypothetical protein
MKTLLLLVALVTPALAQEPLAEPQRTYLIEGFMKYCLGTMSTPSMKVAWTKQETEDFCGCTSVTMADRTTQEQYDARQQQGKYPPEWWTMRQEVGMYCTKKYVKTPDVTDIKNRKW